MPSLRIGISSDFVLNNSRIGIGTTNPQAPLDVRGAIKGDFNLSGVATLSAYSGFVPEFQNISVASTIGFSTSGVGTFIQVTESETGYLSLSGEFNTVSEDIIVDEGRIFEVSVGSTFVPGTLESVSVQSHFSVPNGGTTARNANPVEGMVRFNDDLNTLEFWNGFEWRQFTVTGASGRGVFASGGRFPTGTTIDYINISSTGNALNFGTAFSTIYTSTNCSSSTRGIAAGGFPTTNVIQYITIASEGNSIDFGDLTLARYYLTGFSSSTRGIFGGGNAPPALSNVIDYIQIATIGNALDFGDLSTTKQQLAGCSSPTRGIFGGGDTPNLTNIVEYVNISSTGNSINFGSLTQSKNGLTSCSSSTRGLFAGGNNSSLLKTIDYITIASVGNAINFGDLTIERKGIGACSSPTRGVFGGGFTPTGGPAGTFYNIIDYITISSTGNAQDFGDLTVSRGDLNGGCSDSHGGLGGF